MMRPLSAMRSIVARVRRDGQAPAVVVVAMVVVGLGLSLFGQNVVGEIGLALIACAGGVFATLAVARSLVKAAIDQAAVATSAVDSAKQEVCVGQKPMLDLLTVERESLAVGSNLIAARRQRSGGGLSVERAGRRGAVIDAVLRALANHLRLKLLCSFGRGRSLGERNQSADRYEPVRPVPTPGKATGRRVGDHTASRTERLQSGGGRPHSGIGREHGRAAFTQCPSATATAIAV
jgi:hypothetical protein